MADSFDLRMNRMAEHLDHATTLAVQHKERLDRLISTVATLAGTVTKLAAVIELHERRTDGLEGEQ